MKKKLAGLVVMLVLAAVMGQAQSDGKSAGSVETQIVAMEHKWAAAVKSNDAEAVAPMVAESYVNMNARGMLSGKAKLLDSVKKGKWEMGELSDIKVQSYGSSAIATGAWYGKGTGPDGKPVEVHERWMDTWVKMPGGKWQCVATANAMK